MLTFKWQNGEMPIEVVLYKYNGKGKSDAGTVEVANEIWRKRCNDKHIKGLMALLPDGRVMMKPKNVHYRKDVKVRENMMKPSEFIKMVTGCYANEWLPDDTPTYKTLNRRLQKFTEHATTKQEELLRKFGIIQLRGLTKRQASALISLLIDRDRCDLASPWMLKQISRDFGISPLDMSQYCNMSKVEAMKIIEEG